MRAAAVFRDPILSWTTEVPIRFFQAMYGALNTMLRIQPSDLAATPGATLADCSATVRIFGSNTTLTLRANAFVADFPNIAVGQLQFANAIVLQGYDALRNAFSDLEISFIEAGAGHFFKFVESGNIEDIIRGYPDSLSTNQKKILDDTIIEAASRFKLVDKNGRWSSRVTAERSELSGSDIFVHRDLRINDLDSIKDAKQVFELVSQIDQKILGLLGLIVEGN